MDGGFVSRFTAIPDTLKSRILPRPDCRKRAFAILLPCAGLHDSQNRRPRARIRLAADIGPDRRHDRLATRHRRADAGHPGRSLLLRLGEESRLGLFRPSAGRRLAWARHALAAWLRLHGQARRDHRRNSDPVGARALLSELRPLRPQGPGARADPGLRDPSGARWRRHHHPGYRIGARSGRWPCTKASARWPGIPGAGSRRGSR